MLFLCRMRCWRLLPAFLLCLRLCLRLSLLRLSLCMTRLPFRLCLRLPLVCRLLCICLEGHLFLSGILLLLRFLLAEALLRVCQPPLIFPLRLLFCLSGQRRSTSASPLLLLVCMVENRSRLLL